MAMQYINYIKNRTPFAPKSEAPVLSEDDEAFLNKITSEENPPALPPRPDAENASPLPFKDAQFALMDGAQNVSCSRLFRVSMPLNDHAGITRPSHNRPESLIVAIADTVAGYPTG